MPPWASTVTIGAAMSGGQIKGAQDLLAWQGAIGAARLADSSAPPVATLIAALPLELRAPVDVTLAGLQALPPADPPDVTYTFKPNKTAANKRAGALVADTKQWGSVVYSSLVAKAPRGVIDPQLVQTAATGFARASNGDGGAVVTGRGWLPKCKASGGGVFFLTPPCTEQHCSSSRNSRQWQRWQQLWQTVPLLSHQPLICSPVRDGVAAAAASVWALIRTGAAGCHHRRQQPSIQPPVNRLCYSLTGCTTTCRRPRHQSQQVSIGRWLQAVQVDRMSPTLATGHRPAAQSCPRSPQTVLIRQPRHRRAGGVPSSC